MFSIIVWDEGFSVAAVNSPICEVFSLFACVFCLCLSLSLFLSVLLSLSMPVPASLSLSLPLCPSVSLHACPCLSLSLSVSAWIFSTFIRWVFSLWSFFFLPFVFCCSFFVLSASLVGCLFPGDLLVEGQSWGCCVMCRGRVTERPF